MITTNKTIKIYTKEITTKDGSRKFLAHSINIKGVWYQVKFASKAASKPTSTGYWNVAVGQYFIKPNGEFNPIFYVCQSSSCVKDKLPKEVDILIESPEEKVDFSQVY